MTSPTDSKIITTDLFTVKPGTYLRCLASRWLDIYGLRIGIPLLAALFIGGAFDLRIAISIIFLAMVATPMVGLIFYWRYGTIVDAARTVIPQRATIRTGYDITIEYTPTETWPDPPVARHIKWSDIVSVNRRSGLTVYYLKGSDLPMVIIPDCSITTENHA